MVRSTHQTSGKGYIRFFFNEIYIHTKSYSPLSLPTKRLAKNTLHYQIYIPHIRQLTYTREHDSRLTFPTMQNCKRPVEIVELRTRRHPGVQLKPETVKAHSVTVNSRQKRPPSHEISVYARHQTDGSVVNWWCSDCRFFTEVYRTVLAQSVDLFTQGSLLASLIKRYPFGGVWRSVDQFF